jgi:hypothetical protein
MAMQTEEFITLYNKESELKDQLKLITEKRREIEVKIVNAMLAQGLTSMQVGPYTIVARQKKSKKAMSKDAMAEQIAKEVNSNADSVKKAIEKAKESQSVEIKTSLKPVHGHV